MAEIAAPAALKISSSPHIAMEESVAQIMWRVNLALLPAALAGIYFYGLGALLVIALSVGACLAGEAACLKLRGREIALSDGSAVVAGLLLAFNLPPNAPWYLPVVGGLFTIVVAKHAFGGLGQNIFNPALAGRAFLLAAYPVAMTTSYVLRGNAPLSGYASGIDTLSSATPLTALKEGYKAMAALSGTELADFSRELTNLASLPTLQNMLIGNIGGVIGEASVLALLLGAVFLFWKRVITWTIPLSFCLSVFVLSLPQVFGPAGSWLWPFFQLCSGGLILGAFFMATDMVTSPVTFKGQLLFGIGCGVITVVIRNFGALAEGVSYAILLMNCAVPLIDRYIRPRRFGAVKGAVK
jgi:H+/Na+-translocating ferredoxin:NAD+ oxidoreductase subunit D